MLHCLSQQDQFVQRIWGWPTTEVSESERMAQLRAFDMSFVLYACSAKRWKCPLVQEIVQPAQQDSHARDFTTVAWLRLSTV